MGQKLEENAEGTTEEDRDGETWRSRRVCDGWRDERCGEEEDEGMKRDRWIVMTIHWRVCVCVCARSRGHLFSFFPATCDLLPTV